MSSLLLEISELRALLDSQVSFPLALYSWTKNAYSLQASPLKHYANPLKLDMALAKDRQINILRKKVSRQGSLACSNSASSEDGGEASPPFEQDLFSPSDQEGGVTLERLSVSQSDNALA